MKIKFNKDDKQNIVTIETIDNIKLSFTAKDFYRICNITFGTFTTKFTKEQWTLTSVRRLEGNIITLTRKAKVITFLTTQIPKNISH